MTFEQIHDIMLFIFFLCANVIILRTVYLTYLYYKYAKQAQLQILEHLFANMMVFCAILSVRTLLLMFTSGDYYLFQITRLKQFISHYGNLTLYILTLSSLLKFFHLIFRYTKKDVHF